MYVDALNHVIMAATYINKTTRLLQECVYYNVYIVIMYRLATTWHVYQTGLLYLSVFYTLICYAAVLKILAYYTQYHAQE